MFIFYIGLYKYNNLIFNLYYFYKVFENIYSIVKSNKKETV